MHDFKFHVSADNEDIMFSVGMPQGYFRRFDIDGIKNVEIFSRYTVVDRSERGWVINDDRKISLSKFSIKNYLYFLNPFFIFRLAKALTRFQFVVINFPTINGIVLGCICVLLKVPFSLEVACDDKLFDEKLLGFMPKYILRFLGPIIAQKSVGALYVAEYLKELYPSLGIKETVSNVIIEEVLLGSAAEKGVGESINILFVGFLSRRKGLDVLLQACSMIKKKQIDFNLHIVGSENDYDLPSNVDRYDLSDNTTYHGVVERPVVNDLYKKSHIFCLPSLSEGLPRVVLEAMSYGVPVVSTRLPGVVSLIDKDCLFDSNDVYGLYQILDKLIFDANFYRQQSAKNIKTAELFLDKNLLPRRKKYYQELLKDRSRKKINTLAK